MVKRNNIPVPQILVQWAQLGEEEAEDYDEIRKQFPGISLEEKTNFERSFPPPILQPGEEREERVTSPAIIYVLVRLSYYNW